MTQIFGAVVFYMWNLFSVVVFHRSIVDWRGYVCPRYVCILLYVKLIWCSGVPQICGLLEGGMSGLGICAFFYMWNLFSVVVFHRSMVDQKGGTSALCICAFCYMLCAFCYMWNLFGAVVFHRSMVDWRGRGVKCISVCTSSEKMSSLQVWLLLHRGLFYERPIIFLIKEHIPLIFVKQVGWSYY